MIIDKKGKLFGKINIIDLLLIFVLIAVVGIVGYKFLGKVADAGGSAKSAVMKFYAEEVSDFVLDGTINIGDNITDVQTKAFLGTVKEIETGEAVSYGTDAQGKWIQSSKPGYKSILITADVNGTEFNHGIIIENTRYYVGHTFTLAAGGAKIYLRVYSIDFSE